MDERQKLAFEAAQDVTKQLIGLSTGIIALTITFAHDIVGGAPGSARWWAYAAWAAFLVSIMFGLATLMAMTGQLGQVKDAPAPSIYGKGVTGLAGAQIATFVVALLLAVVFGGVSATGNKQAQHGIPSDSCAVEGTPGQ